MSTGEDTLQVARLARLLRGMEARGAYNGATVVRALLERELVRLATSDAPTTAAGAAAAVGALADELAAAGEGPALVGSLRAIASAVADDQPIPVALVPAASTCRVCGELFLGDPPAACPRCEAPSLSFREHLPIWYLEPMTPAAALAALEGGPARIAAILGDRSEAALDLPPRPGEWSARETLEHLVTAEELFAGRVHRLLADDDPELVAMAAWAQAGDEDTVPTDLGAGALATRFGELRAGTLRVLRDLDEAGWARSGRHSEWGRVTVTSQAAYFVRHEASHLAQLAAAAEGRVPGERR